MDGTDHSLSMHPPDVTTGTEDDDSLSTTPLRIEGKTTGYRLFPAIEPARSTILGSPPQRSFTTAAPVGPRISRSIDNLSRAATQKQTSPTKSITRRSRLIDIAQRRTLSAAHPRVAGESNEATGADIVQPAPSRSPPPRPRSDPCDPVKDLELSIEQMQPAVVPQDLKVVGTGEQSTASGGGATIGLGLTLPTTPAVSAQLPSRSSSLRPEAPTAPWRREEERPSSSRSVQLSLSRDDALAERADFARAGAGPMTPTSATPLHVRMPSLLDERQPAYIVPKGHIRLRNLSAEKEQSRLEQESRAQREKQLNDKRLPSPPKSPHSNTSSSNLQLPSSKFAVQARHARSMEDMGRKPRLDVLTTQMPLPTTSIHERPPAPPFAAHARQDSSDYVDSPSSLPSEILRQFPTATGKALPTPPLFESRTRPTAPAEARPPANELSEVSSTSMPQDSVEMLAELLKRSEALHARYSSLRLDRLALSAAHSASLKEQTASESNANVLLDQHLSINAITSYMDICIAKLKALDCKKDEAIAALLAEKKRAEAVDRKGEEPKTTASKEVMKESKETAGEAPRSREETNTKANEHEELQANKAQKRLSTMTYVTAVSQASTPSTPTTPKTYKPSDSSNPKPINGQSVASRLSRPMSHMPDLDPPEMPPLTHLGVHQMNNSTFNVHSVRASFVSAVSAHDFDASHSRSSSVSDMTDDAPSASSSPTEKSPPRQGDQRNDLEEQPAAKDQAQTDQEARGEKEEEEDDAEEEENTSAATSLTSDLSARTESWLEAQTEIDTPTAEEKPLSPFGAKRLPSLRKNIKYSIPAIQVVLDESSLSEMLEYYGSETLY